jgi:hypothetical protein
MYDAAMAKKLEGFTKRVRGVNGKRRSIICKATHKERFERA